MPEVSLHKRRSLIYLALVILLSAVAYFFVFRIGFAGSMLKIPVVFWLMWCPAFAAFAASLLTRRRFRDLGWFPGPPRYLFAGWLVPIAYATVAYGAVWIMGLGGVPNHEFLARIAAQLHLGGRPESFIALAGFGYIATLGTALGVISAIGEEIGWRGFWVPELAGWLGFRRAAIFSGAFWALWHWPAILFTEYSSGTPRPYELACFSAMVISIAVLFAWIRLKSGSLWPCALLHASHNAIIQGFFDRITTDKGHTLYFTTEFGIALVVPTLLIAGWCWLHSAAAEPADRLATAA